MYRISNFVPFADPYQIPEVVGDDTQVIAMVIDIRGKEGAVPPAEDHLFAPAGRLPIDFDVELIGLDQPWRLGQSLAHLSQEEHKTVGSCAVALQRGVGLEGQPPVDGSTHQTQSFG
jgi:hypothetical protein